MLVVSSILLWAIVLVNLLLTVGLARRVRNTLPRTEMLKVGQRAPDFSAKTLEAEVVTLATFARQPVAFVFVSPDCEPCREELPRLADLRPRAKRFGVELVLVSDADEDKTLPFVMRISDGLPVLVAPRDRTSFLIDYRVVGTPSYYLVDAQGKVRAAGMGVAELEAEMGGLAREVRGGDGTGGYGR